MTNGVDDYLRRLERELGRLGLHDASIVDEARDHLVDAVDAGMKRGLAEDDAEREALERFGAPELIAAHAASERNRMTNRLGGAFQTMWARKWWILAPTVVTAAVTSLMTSYLLPTLYRSEMVIQVISPPPAQGTVIVTANEYARLEQILWNRTRLERIISDFNLYQSEAEDTPRSELVERTRRSIEIRMQGAWGTKDSFVRSFAVSFTYPDPKHAMRVTERLASLIIDNTLREREGVLEGTSQFLEAQIVELRRRIVSHETTLAGLRAQSGGRPLSQADLVPYEVLLDRYRALLIQSEESKTLGYVERRQMNEQFRIVEPARLPERPVGPSRQQVNVAGTIAGFALGLVLLATRRKVPRDITGH